jgi:6,7-dimethyl-8-ribityllumazine synthase
MSSSIIRKIVSLSNPISTDLRIGIVVSDYYNDITSKLLTGAIDTLTQNKVKRQNISILHVPGSFELIAGANKMLEYYENYNGFVVLGCVIKGETDHDQFINQAIINAMSSMMMTTNIPIGLGLLTVNTMEQALDRSGGQYGNKGSEAALAVLAVLTNEIKNLEEE